MRRAVFLDRDGTLNVEAGYITDPEEFRLYPWTAQAVRQINQGGMLAIVVTNQSGIARGFYPESTVHAMHDKLQALLAAEGAHLDAIYYCPHHPTAGVNEFALDCNCRKPKPGLLLEAAARYGIDLRSSYMIGDKALDVQVGRAAGATAILLRTGFGIGEIARLGTEQIDADRIADTLLDAVEWISRRE
ncbi:MAG: D-glycero-beta-D-manno-heptose 1,7-bisphosphate 7-phosphatase [Acidobacteriota bacterium]